MEHLIKYSDQIEMSQMYISGLQTILHVSLVRRAIPQNSFDAQAIRP